MPTALGGELVASAIAEGDVRYAEFADAFGPVYAGWPLGPVAAQATYSGLTLIDHLRMWYDRTDFKTYLR